MQSEQPQSGDGLSDHLARIDRRIRRDQLRHQIREMGGIVGGADGDEVSDVELSFLERVVAWETGPRTSHRAWLARSGQVFIPPAELHGPGLEAELWRLIHALAGARVFLYHTNHLSDEELYARLWNDVLPAESPECCRGPDDACHWDFADPSAEEEQTWLRFHATRRERRDWSREFPEVVMPERTCPPYARDHRLPVRD